MPDLSFFMPLCTLLDVTLNELFAGECIAEEKLKEKADEVLMDVITNWLGHDKWESKESDTTPENVLEVENVSKLYETENNSVLAVNDVSFQIPHGNFVGIMGASGSGKTTLLNLIATIDKPTNGTIRISGQNIVDIPDETTAEFRRRHLGFVFQEYNLLETLTIYENIALALTIKEVSKESIRATILMITHDVMAASYCDRILFMKDGEIKAALNREQENKQTFFADILKKMEWIEGESHDVLEIVNS